MYPWCDPAGRFSAGKLLVFVALFLPGAWTVYAFAFGLLGPRPDDEAIRAFGLWMIRFLFIALAITPLRQILRWNWLIRIRRMVGVAAFFYGLSHLFLYTAVQQKFHLVTVASEIVLRFYLTIGFTALLGLAALAATSTDGMVRRMGGKAWARLHRLIYVIGALAVTHYFIQAKLEVVEPTIMGGLYLWLMGYRAIAALRASGRLGPALLAALALGAAGLTALAEALYFHLLSGVDVILVLSANLTAESGVRPSWVVLAITAPLAAAALIRGRMAPRRAPRRTLSPAAQPAD
jgi:sulfoxide reductase heme-binding subunit YedZ